MELAVKVFIHREGDRYWAEVPAIPGCVSEGETLEELRAEIRESIEGWWESMHDRPAAPSGPDSAPVETLTL